MTSNDTTTVPMCVICDTHPVTIIVNSTGAGYCSPECEASYCEEDAYKAFWEFDRPNCLDADARDEEWEPLWDGLRSDDR